MNRVCARKIKILLLLVICIQTTYSQSLFSGKIQNQQNKEISDALIVLMQTDSAIVSYTMSDEAGNYKLTYTGKASHLLLSISGFNIKQQVRKIENHTQIVNFIIAEGSIELREVLVKSTKTWGDKDTLNYLTSAFKDKKDIVIGDVLKKMPGIDVKESGQITYKGKPINKFYIENLDLLQGRYNIATKNISVDDISTIQVFENHQPIRALEKTQFSTEAAINLKIKDNKKGIFSIMAALGVGADSNLLWEKDLTGMFFGKKRQHLVTYKTNNRGTDIRKELQSFHSNSLLKNMQFSYIKQPTSPSIRFERYNFNKTHAITINNLFKLKNSAEVNANVVFFHNRDRQHSFTRTSYLLPGEEMKIIAEDLSAKTTTHSLEGELRYNLNIDRIYFNNFLCVSGAWDDSKGDVRMGLNVRQQLNNKSFSANNITHWIKRGEDERGIEFLSKNAFRTQPHQLTILPGLYPDRFNEGNDYASLKQNVRGDAFSSTNYFSILSAIKFGYLKLNPAITLDVDHQKLSSDFTCIDYQEYWHSITDVDMRNDIALTRIKAGVSLNAAYNSELFKMNLYFPVNHYNTNVENQLIKKIKNHDRNFYFQPSFTARYHFNPKLEMTANGGIQVLTPDLKTLYTGYILQNYRNLNRYDTRLFDSNNKGVALGIAYKDVLDMLFVGGDLLYNQYKSDGLYGQTLEDALTITQLVMEPNGGQSFSVNGRFSKGFDWKAFVFSAEASLGRSKSEQLRQESFIDYTGSWLNINTTIHLKFFHWLIAEYKASWAKNQGEVSSGEHFPTMRSVNQRLGIDVLLPFEIGLNGTLEHYYNNAVDGNRNFPLADLGLFFTYRRVRFSLDWTNMLNTSKYISTSYGTLNSYYSEYDIRPMAILLNVRFKLL